MKKRILSALVVLCMILACLPATVFAAETEGTCGDNLTWAYDAATATLTISGTGEMADYGYFSPTPWNNYADSIINVVIAEGVTSVGIDAFYDCNNLVSAKLPDSIVSIGVDAFCRCFSLVDVAIPAGVTSIGLGAFANCTSLTSATIPAGVTSIEMDTFGNCSSLKSVTISEGVVTIDDFAFTSCTSLTNVVIPDSVTTIEDFAFDNCTSLTNVVIPDSVTTIGASAFERCSGLTSVTLPKDLAVIEEYLFYGCTNLTDIVIPNSVTTIASGAFCGCSSLTEITIHDGITDIGSYAFANCTSLTGFQVDPNNPNYSNDEYGVMFDKEQKTLVQAPGTLSGHYVIPASVTELGICAFAGCRNLTSVTIPDGITTIANSAFEGCISLTDVVIPDGVTTIGFDAFYSCTALTSITLPESITTIDKYAFMDCTSLTSIVIPEGVTEIRQMTFYNCTSLASVTIPESVTTIDIVAFRNCTSLTSITIPAGITFVSKTAFEGCTALKAMIFEGNAPTTDNDYARFAATVYYPAGNTTWTEDVRNQFGYGTTFVKYEAGETPWEDPEGSHGIWGDNITWSFDGTTGTLTFSGEGAMEDGYSGYTWDIHKGNAKKVVIESGITNVPYDAFRNYPNLEEAVLGETVTDIGTDAFAYCTNLKQVNLPDGLKTLEYGCFYKTGLTVVSIPAGVTLVDFNVFASSDLISLTIPGNVTLSASEYYTALRSCYDLHQIIFTGDYEETLNKWTFTNITANAYYPANNATWTEDVLLDYGGDITWIPYTEIPEPPIPNPFVDVIWNTYYYDPVLWAVENGITNGLTPTTFGVDETCTRAQVVTFLWRAAGSPAPTSDVNPFEDVEENQFYSEAVLWAVGNGITNGLSTTRFGVNEPCTREQVVTFLCRYAGGSAPEGTVNPFADVEENQFYSEAVAWAVANGVTTGLNATTFGVGSPCSRAMVVTFLYRVQN